MGTEFSKIQGRSKGRGRGGVLLPSFSPIFVAATASYAKLHSE